MLAEELAVLRGHEIQVMKHSARDGLAAPINEIEREASQPTVDRQRDRERGGLFERFVRAVRREGERAELDRVLIAASNRRADEDTHDADHQHRQ